VTFELGWLLARKRGFQYDSARIARWREGGELRTYPPR
jgi:hypothetical protein